MSSVATPDADAPLLRVVVVDDTEDLRQLLSLALRRGGFDVVGEAEDGEAGIERVRELRPDVVLLDLAMPVLDGIAALPTIRSLVPEATIVVLSGFGAQQMSARALAEGADGYVQKGTSLPGMLDYLRTLCATRAAGDGRARPATDAGPAAPAPSRPAPPAPAATPAPSAPPAPEDPGAAVARALARAETRRPAALVRDLLADVERWGRDLSDEVVVRSDPDADAARVHADPAQLGLLLAGLVGHASRPGSDGVRLCVEPPGTLLVEAAPGSADDLDADLTVGRALAGVAGGGLDLVGGTLTLRLPTVDGAA